MFKNKRSINNAIACPFVNKFPLILLLLYISSLQQFSCLQKITGDTQTFAVKVFGKYIPHRYKPDQAKAELKPQNDYKKVLNLHFIKGFSEKIKRELRKEGISVVFGKGKPLESSL